jgi:hypothetical protein
MCHSSPVEEAAVISFNVMAWRESQTDRAFID